MSVSDKLSGTMLLSSNTDVSQMFHISEYEMCHLKQRWHAYFHI